MELEGHDLFRSPERSRDRAVTIRSKAGHGEPSKPHRGMLMVDESVVDWYISDHLGRVNGRVPTIATASFGCLPPDGLPNICSKTAQNYIERASVGHKNGVCSVYKTSEGKAFFWVNRGPMRAEEIWEESRVDGY
ncbi:hypothetical protein DFH09DRAFT_1070273 [Mycena vulgaris]|nr:hypothetical protein DFH09DRAFT_1070273 [Mycena vulgaris]